MNGTPSIWINGKLLPADEMRCSPFDLGLTVGLGLFETMVSYDGAVFMLNEHYQRMVAGDQKLGLGLAIPDVDVLMGGVASVLKANDLNTGRARIRVTVSAGVNALTGGDAAGNVMITAVSLADPTPVAQLSLSTHVIDEGSILTGTKSLAYAANVIAYRQAIQAGADEAVLMNKKEDVCECAMSNLFIVKDGNVITPPLSSGCLAGVTRSLVMELCKQLGVPVIEQNFQKKDLLEADEIFITSSTREVQPAVMLGADLGEHPVTSNLCAAYRLHNHH